MIALPDTIKIADLAPEAWSEIAALLERNGGTVTPEDLVEAARSPESALHKYFVWDDHEAARRYRIVQAQKIIRSVHIILELGGKPVTTRALWQTDPANDDELTLPRRPYRLVTVVMQHPDWRSQLLEQAKRDMLAWRQRYAILNELAPLFAAIDQGLLLLAHTEVS